MLQQYRRARQRGKELLERHRTTPVTVRYACTERIISGEAIKAAVELEKPGKVSQNRAEQFVRDFTEDYLRHHPAEDEESVCAAVAEWAARVMPLGMIIRPVMIERQVKQAFRERRWQRDHDGCWDRDKQIHLINGGACSFPGLCPKGILRVPPRNSGRTTFAARVWLLKYLARVRDCVAILYNSVRLIAAARPLTTGPITVYRGHITQAVSHSGYSENTFRAYLSMGVDYGLLGCPELFQDKAERDSIIVKDEVWVPMDIYPHMTAPLHNWFMALIPFLLRNDTPMFRERTKVYRWKRRSAANRGASSNRIREAGFLHGQSGAPLARYTPFLATLAALSHLDRRGLNACDQEDVVNALATVRQLMGDRVWKRPEIRGVLRVLSRMDGKW